MSFQLEPGVELPHNIRRIAAEQVARARKCLAHPPNGDVHEGIHEARKCFKRLRGVVRMARPALGKDVYRKENARFRDAGRALSTVRDTQALVESFDLLEQAYGRRVAFERMRPLRHALAERREAVEDDAADLEARVSDVAAMLEGSAAAIDRWPLADADAGDLARGMQRVYRRARKGWEQARTAHDPDRLHDWRKRAKYLRYQFQLLKGVDESWARDCHKGFRKLSDLLGDHHDLEVLRGVLDDMDAAVIAPVAESEFRVLLREQQDAFYRDALQLGDALLGRKPRKMRRRVQRRLDTLTPNG